MCFTSLQNIASQTIRISGTRKKRVAIFQSLAGMSLAGNNLTIPAQGEFGQ
jgi:hypothetical protein